MDEDSFVPIAIQNKLYQNGWILTYSSFDKNRASCGFVGVGLQTWVKGGIMLDVSYSSDEYKRTHGSKNVELWYGENDSEEFSLRNIISVLKRRNLL